MSKVSRRFDCPSEILDLTKEDSKDWESWKFAYEQEDGLRFIPSSSIFHAELSADSTDTRTDMDMDKDNLIGLQNSLILPPTTDDDFHIHRSAPASP
jgi:hypothetical protein